MRKRTGNHNKYRSGGRSTYSVERKSVSADSYGTWNQGRQERPDTIAGRTLTYRTPADQRGAPRRWRMSARFRSHIVAAGLLCALVCLCLAGVVGR